MSFPSNYLLPLFEHKQIAKKTQRISDRWFREKDYERVTSQLKEKLQADYEREVQAGWNMNDYVYRFEKKKQNRQHADDHWEVTGELYIQRLVEGDLSRLYLRVMYGLAEFYGVPILDTEIGDYSVWDRRSTDPLADYYWVPETLNNQVTGTKFPFGQLCQQALELAKRGEASKLQSILGSKTQHQNLMQLNLIHHSSSTGIANPPNLKQGSYEREIFPCEQPKKAKQR